jgi:hypothetical protein
MWIGEEIYFIKERNVIKKRMVMAAIAVIGLLFLMNTADSQALGRGQQWVRSHSFTVNAMSETGLNFPGYRDVGFSSVLELVNQTNYDSFTISALDESSHTSFGWHWMTSDSDYNWIRTTAQTFLNDYPNNLGFCVGDESNPSLFPQMASLLDDIRTIAPNSLVYHAALGLDGYNNNSENYATYINSVINTLKPDVLMYDQYPFYNGSTATNFYTNLAIVREKALAAGIPYWCWLQSFGRTDISQQEPSESEMRLQAFAALAYGYTGLSYWTYASAYEPYSNAMLNAYTVPTAMYYSAKNLVPEVRRIGEVTKSLTSTGVYFQPGSGYTNPAGTTLWSSSVDSQLIDVTAVSGQGFIIGLFKDDQNKKYFMVVNANHAAGSNAAGTAAKVSLQFASSVTSLARLNRSTGRFEIVTPSQLANYELQGGTGDLFKYDTTGLATYEFPTSFAANPTGQWSLMTGAPEWSTANDLTAMIPNSAAPNWKCSGYNTPRVDGDLWVLCGNEAIGNKAGVLVFRVPATGRYSINTLLYAYGAEGDPTTEYLSVRVASDASLPAVTLWSSSYSWAAGSGVVTSWDMADVSQLQNIDLKAGSYIFFSMNLATQSYYPTAYNRFYKADGSLGGAITFEESPVAAVYTAPVTFATNPQNQWSLRYGSNEWSMANDLALMAPNSSAPNWNCPGYGAPRVDGDLWVLAGNAAWPGNDAGVLVFQAPITGRYRIKTIWYAYGAEGDPTTEYLSVKMAQNASASAKTLWSMSYSWPTGSGMVTSWNLVNVPELQDVELTAGACVFFSMNVETKTYYPTAYNRFIYPPMVTLIRSTIPGDANSDGAVNVNDLSVLAAYYNTTSGATWAMGDFDGDHDVDVADLSLLAANYNYGSASTLSWADAYAQVFGTTTVETENVSDDVNKEDSSSSACSSLGLSLIAGLAMIGLVYVKMEE